MEADRRHVEGTGKPGWQAALTAARVRTIAGLFVLLALASVLIQLAPLYLDSLDFSHELQAYVASEAPVGKTGEMIRVEVANRAVRRGLSVRPDNVVVSGGGETLRVEVRYQIHVDLLIYTVNLHLRAKSGA